MEPIATNASSTSAIAATVAQSPSPFPASGFAVRSAAAGALLAALAMAALVMAHRRRRSPRLLEIVESASVGPKRSLVVARMGDELLLLGSSESGIALLSSRPAPVASASSQQPHAAGQEPQPGLAPVGHPGPDRDETIHRAQGGDPRYQPAARPAPGTSVASALLTRLRRQPAPDPFDALLAESVEDLELRRKLAAGHAGSVR